MNKEKEKYSMEYYFSERKENWVSDLLFPRFKGVNKETYQIGEIVKFIRESNHQCFYLTGDSGCGKTQSAKEILRRMKENYEYVVFWCNEKNLELSNLRSELERNKEGSKIIVCFDGFNNLSDNMMKETGKYIDELRRDEIIVIVTTIKIPFEINEIMHVEFNVQEIEEKNRKRYLENSSNRKARELIKLLNSPILLRMAKETTIWTSYEGYVQNMKETCHTAADVFWNYNLNFIGKILESNEEDWKKRCFSFQFLTGIIADIMYERGDKVNKEQLVMALKQMCETRYLEYCLEWEKLTKDWFLNENGVVECVELLVKLNVMQEEIDIFFSHDLYLEFYLALHEYNLTYWIINKNEKFVPKVTLNDKVGNLYFGLFDDQEIEKLKKGAQISCGKGEENYRARKAYDVLSDIYYYGNGSSVVKRNVDQAYHYSEKAYKLGDGWAAWNCGYLLKEKAQKAKNEGKETEALGLYNKGFDMLVNYLEQCKAKEEQEYYAVYDILAQYYIYGWLEKTCDENTRYSKAEQYLLKAEEGNYMYSYNKHARLYEEDKLNIAEGEDKYVKAYELYIKAAGQKELWAVAMVALYKWRLYNHVDKHKLNKKEAREEARSYLESVYRREEEFTKVITLERRDRYKNGYVNLGLIYVEKGEEEQDEDKKRNYFAKAYEYYSKAHDIDEKDVNICLMLYYLQIRLGKELNENWIGCSLQEILENKNLCREYGEREKALGLDSGKYYQRKLREMVKFSERMSENSKRVEGDGDGAWSFYRYVNIICQVIDFVGEGTTAESICQLLFKRARIEKDIQKMIEESGIVPGMLLAFGDEVQKDIIVCGKKQEVLMLDNHFEKVPEEMEFDSLIDLASVTKIFTCVVTMKLYELGEIDINHEIGMYDTRFTNISQIKIRELMDFTVPLKTEIHIGRAETTDMAERYLFAIKEDRENPKSRYSDMGAMVLKYVLEAKMKVPFWELIKEYILTPCGMSHTYCEVPEEYVKKCINNNYERKIINGHYMCDCSTEKGLCHDAKARMLRRDMFSLQGHAGLFSTVEDMAKFAQCLIGEKIISKKSMKIIGKNYACEVRGENQNCQFFGLLSYVKNPVQANSEVYHALSSDAFSMGGYTGNYLTIDFENKLFLFMASNRCHNRITQSESNEERQIWNDGNSYVYSKPFAWKRDEIVYKALNLAIQCKFVKEALNNYCENQGMDWR